MSSSTGVTWALVPGLQKPPSKSDLQNENSFSIQIISSGSLHLLISVDSSIPLVRVTFSHLVPKPETLPAVSSLTNVTVTGQLAPPSLDSTPLPSWTQ